MKEALKSHFLMKVQKALNKETLFGLAEKVGSCNDVVSPKLLFCYYFLKRKYIFFFFLLRIYKLVLSGT